MWLLENDGDVFHGKKLWLRPGKKFLFGRTLADAGGFVIANKTISRKHLVIEVNLVEKENNALLPIRSQVVLEDLNTKIGTFVDDKQIRGQRHVLDGDEHTIKLGHHEELFKITWYPVVFSYSFGAKELRANPLQALRERLEPLDITVLADYVREITTHVVAKKRNTPKGLQALINGKFIVDHSFVDAVVNAAKASDDAESPLEADFVSNWPDPLQHLPPRGQEPTDRPSTSYLPDLRRQEIFEGYTFVFYDQAQFDNLLAPITNGKGKALVYPVDSETTQVDEFVRYVKSVAGEKGLGEFEDGSEGKGVVVVKFQPGKGQTTDWFAEFGRDISQHLDHRLIEQSEFLDAILNNNASVLRKPLEPEQSGLCAPPPTAASNQHTNQLSSSVLTSQTVIDENSKTEVLGGSVPASAPNARKFGRSRRTVTSRFKGFDAEFDTPDVSESMSAAQMQPLVTSSQQSGLFVSQRQEMEVESPHDRSIRKRPLSPIEDEEDLLEQLAPAAARLKRRRLEEAAARRQRGELTPPPAPVVQSKPEIVKSKPKKIKKEVDILEEARKQREKEDELARADREALLEAMKGMDIDHIRNIAVIEEMEVKRSAPPPLVMAHGDDGERWDDKWNGRKNFKKFRRRGEGEPRLVNKVIVPLEEVKKKDFGIGDEYWLEGDGKKKKKGKGRQKGSEQSNQAQSQTDAVTGQQIESADHDDEIEIMDSPASTQMAASSRTRKLADKTNASQTLSMQSKRPATEGLAKTAPVKKARQTKRRQDSDSDDGLGFRFRKRS